MDAEEPDRGLDFDALQLRQHPAASRVKKLAAEIPASYVAFDLLALSGEALLDLQKRFSGLRVIPLATNSGKGGAVLWADASDSPAALPDSRSRWEAIWASTKDASWSIGTLVVIFALACMGLNILVGYTGQVSIGHGAFMSVGAYTAANLAQR